MSEPNQPESSGQKWERLGFAYCKIASVALLAGRFALPLAASLACLFFTLSWLKGQKETRCIGRYPLAVALFWAAILAIWIAIQTVPQLSVARHYWP